MVRLRLSASEGDLRGCSAEGDLLHAGTTRSFILRPRTALQATRKRPAAGSLFEMLATVGLVDLTDKLVSLGIKKPGDLALVDESLKMRLALPPVSRAKLEKLLSLVEPQASRCLPRSQSLPVPVLDIGRPRWGQHQPRRIGPTSLLPRSAPEDCHVQLVRDLKAVYGSTGRSAVAKSVAPFRCIIKLCGVVWCGSVHCASRTKCNLVSA